MDELLRLLEAWRIMRLGNREVVDGLVAPEHRGPSPELRGVLDRWKGGWYWADAARRRLVLIPPTAEARPPRWILHAVLFAVTIVCSLGAGAALAGVWSPWLASGFLGVFTGAAQFFVGMVLGEWRPLVQGWTFAVPLLGILLVHEGGHYFAARRYDIDTTPPFFLPIPPTLSPIGSLGAFIRLPSPVPAPHPPPRRRSFCPCPRRARRSAASARSSGSGARSSTGGSCSTWVRRGRWPGSSSRWRCWCGAIASRPRRSRRSAWEPARRR